MSSGRYKYYELENALGGLLVSSRMLLEVMDKPLRTPEMDRALAYLKTAIKKAETTLEAWKRAPYNPIP